MRVLPAVFGVKVRARNWRRSVPCATMKQPLSKTQNGAKITNGFLKSFLPLAPFCGLQNNPNLPTRAQNLFLKRISKLKLFVRALSRRVEACSYCAINESRSETRYSSDRIWFGSEVTLFPC